VVGVHEQLLREISSQPSEDQLKELIEAERDTWTTHNRRKSNPGNRVPMTRVLQCRLRSEGETADHFLEIFKGIGDTLTMVTHMSGGVAEKVQEEIDLEYIRVGVLPQSPGFQSPVYPIVVKQNRNSERGRGNLVQFDKNRDLFKFQEFVAGYKVVDDLRGAHTTCQFSRGEQRWKVWEGDQWTESSRIQLWTSNYQFRSTSGPNLLSSDSTNDTRRGILTPGTSIPTIASQPPMMSRLSFEEESRRSVSSVQTRASRQTQLSSVGAASMQFVPVDNTGNLGAILEMPDPPSLVIFLPTMLLVTRVTRDISIKPGKCDCLAEELTADRRCRRVVLKSSRNYIQSYRTAPTKIAAGYNLCSAGRFQKDGMTEVEKLKRIIIDFQSVDDRLRFVKHYVELQEISRLNERGVA
jgi:protein involved in ribonucleotide reduction